MDDRVRYARNGDITIAYKVVGDGPRDLVYVLGSTTNIGMMWENDEFRRSCERLASFSRLIVFDKRGMGLSDRVEAGTMEDRMDDVRAVLDAVGSQRAAILGLSEGGLMATLFAASHPDRAEALILVGAETREENDAEWAWGDGTREEFEGWMADWSDWGDGRSIDYLAPSQAGDPEARAWWGQLQLQAGSPRTIDAHMRVAFGTDTRAILPTVRVPTLVIHRTGDPVVDVHQGRYLAEHIPGARYVELPGVDHVLVGRRRRHPRRDRGVPDRVPASRRAGSCPGDGPVHRHRRLDRAGGRARRPRVGALLTAHDAAVRRELERHRGREIDTAGDGFLATFDGPARAIRCARAHRDAVAPDRSRSSAPGSTLASASGSATSSAGSPSTSAPGLRALAEAGEVLTSGTVHDLVAGVGHRLRGPRPSCPGRRSGRMADLRRRLRPRPTPRPFAQATGCWSSVTKSASRWTR